MQFRFADALKKFVLMLLPRITTRRWPLAAALGGAGGGCRAISAARARAAASPLHVKIDLDRQTGGRTDGHRPLRRRSSLEARTRRRNAEVDLSENI